MAETYVKAWSLCFGAYAAQMLLIPGKMVTDHFEAPDTPMLKFWIRGQAVSLFGMVYLLNKVDTDTALVTATASAAAIGILYPYNAKFGSVASPEAHARRGTTRTNVASRPKPTNLHSCRRYLSPEIPKIVKYPMVRA